MMSPRKSSNLLRYTHLTSYTTVRVSDLLGSNKEEKEVTKTIQCFESASLLNFNGRFQR